MASVELFHQVFAQPDIGPDPSTLSIMEFFMGVMSVVLCFVMLQLFQEKFGGTMHVLKWASSAAYTVYLIHPPFVVFGLYLYVKILESLGIDVDFNVANANFVIQSDNAMYMWLGFAFTSL